MTTVDIAAKLSVPASVVKDFKVRAMRFLKAAIAKKNGITPSAT
jgi:hypothetical protein